MPVCISCARAIAPVYATYWLSAEWTFCHFPACALLLKGRTLPCRGCVHPQGGHPLREQQQLSRQPCRRKQGPLLWQASRWGPPASAEGSSLGPMAFLGRWAACALPTRCAFYLAICNVPAAYNRSCLLQCSLDMTLSLLIVSGAREC